MLSEAWTHYGERKGESSQIVLTDDYICGERMTILVPAGCMAAIIIITTTELSHSAADIKQRRVNSQLPVRGGDSVKIISFQDLGKMKDINSFKS